MLTKNQWVQCQREENTNLSMAILREAPFSLPGSGQSPVPPRPFLELGAGLAGLQLSKQSAEAAEGLQLA